MKSFIWVDGKRPAAKDAEAFANRLVKRIGVAEYIIQLQGPGNRKRWSIRALRKVTHRLHLCGKRVVFMLWGRASPEALRWQLAFLRDYYKGIAPIVRPNGVQWDLEEQWQNVSRLQADTATATLGQVLDALHTLDQDLTFSVNAVSRFQRRDFRYATQRAINLPAITEGYGQAYKFYHPKVEGHWSRGMPSPDVTVRTIYDAWQKQPLSKVSIGLAAYMQRFPAHMDLPGDSGMRQSFWAAYAAGAQGVGWWSNKAIGTARAATIRNLLQGLE